MATRFTDADIEVHLRPMTEGMPTEGLDVHASEVKAGQLAYEALQDAFPGYHVSLFIEQSVPHAITVVSSPDEVETQEVARVVEEALGDPGEGRWYVLLPAKSE